tara:strand:+ start:57 stop:458 length:402 start_codon:yes stop_codon:yes gene_type:complete
MSSLIVKRPKYRNNSDFVSHLMETTENIFKPLFGEDLRRGAFHSFLEDGDKYFLEVDLPGYDKKDVDLSVKGDILTLKAQREGRAGETLEVDRDYTIPPKARVSKVSASLKDGILLIELPRVEGTKPVSIAIG